MAGHCTHEDLSSVFSSGSGGDSDSGSGGDSGSGSDCGSSGDW